jgi:hypothetical protein
MLGVQDMHSNSCQGLKIGFMVVKQFRARWQEGVGERRRL